MELAIIPVHHRQMGSTLPLHSNQFQYEPLHHLHHWSMNPLFIGVEVVYPPPLTLMCVTAFLPHQAVLFQLRVHFTGAIIDQTVEGKALAAVVGVVLSWAAAAAVVDHFPPMTHYLQAREAMQVLVVAQ